MKRALPALGAAGLAASLCVLFAGAGWIKPFFYLPAWGFALLLLAGLNRRFSGRSRLLDEPASALRMALISIPWWLFYEALNVRLKNWEYHGLPAPLWARWPGYALAFATVLPAVLETADMIESALPKRREAQKGRRLSPGLLQACTILGAACLVLPLLWPRIFFALIWGSVFLMIESLLAREAPEKSWLRSLGEGRPRRAQALLLSGLACGLAWEFFNYWAGAKWVYTFPWPKGPKLFEMPWLGYLGFPPFALGCQSYYSWFRLRWEGAGAGTRVAGALLLCAASLAAFWAVDAFTVRSLVPL